MRWDDRDDDPFSDIFRELERMMDEVAGVDANVNSRTLDDGGTGGDAHFSVYEEDDDIRVVGDLPGIAKEGVDVRCDGRYLTVDAASDAREYRERIELPARVDEHSASASFNNGILEITLERADGSANIDLN